MSFRGFKTKAAFMSFIRSGLRRMWAMQYPPKRVFIAENRRRGPLGVGGREIWGAVCEHCQKTYRTSQMEVDHIKQNHKLTEIEDISNYCDSLFCELSNMRYLCKNCHKHLTYAEKHNMSFDQAVIEKKAIKIMKGNAESQTKWIIKNSKEDPETNSIRRRNQIRSILCDISKHNLQQKEICQEPHD